MIIKVDVIVTAPELAESIMQLACALPQINNGEAEVKNGTMVGETEPLKAITKDSEVEERESGHEEVPKLEENHKEEEMDKEGESDKQEHEVFENKVSLEEVRAKLATLSLEGKQVQVKALITGFGAKKLSEIPEDQYTALLAKAEVL